MVEEKLIEQQEELRKNNLIAREARLAEIEVILTILMMMMEVLGGG